MSVTFNVMPKLLITVKTDKTSEECWYCRETATQAINSLMATDPHELKKLVLEGLIDAMAYPLDFTEVDS
mgnify:FL=1